MTDAQQQSTGTHDQQQGETPESAKEQVANDTTAGDNPGEQASS